MKRILWGIIGLALCVVAVYALELDRVLYPSMTPQEALQRLMQGNGRYIENRMINPKHATDIRAGLVNKQRPFAVILGCSDSRVPPELLFDQNLGDIFVVRVAGNVAGPLEIDSIDYAVLQLKAKLILVLGHENCGAVTAVMNKQTKGIEAVAKMIEPAIEGACQLCDNRIENAVKMNVQAIVQTLRNSADIAPLIRENKVDVVGGYYHLKSGLVELLGRESLLQEHEKK